eukprot:1390189-Amorphochlora_amoeboformis.AAC.1
MYSYILYKYTLKYSFNQVELNALAGLLRAANTDNPKKDKFTLKNMFAPSEVQDVESKVSGT